MCLHVCACARLLHTVVKNWKRRWMILRKDGKLYYFKKQVGCYTDADPRGALNVQTEVRRLCSPIFEYIFFSDHISVYMR